MAYCSLEDITGVIPERELIMLTDDMVPPIAVNQVVVDQAIASAGTLINGYIGARYSIPLATVPELVKSIALDITVYKIYLRRKKGMPSDAVKTGYDDAMKQLRDIQSGKLNLGVDQVGVQAQPAAGSASISSSTRLCSRETMKEF